VVDLYFSNAGPSRCHGEDPGSSGSSGRCRDYRFLLSSAELRVGGLTSSRVLAQVCSALPIVDGLSARFHRCGADRLLKRLPTRLGRRSLIVANFWTGAHKFYRYFIDFCCVVVPARLTFLDDTLARSWAFTKSVGHVRTRSFVRGSFCQKSKGSTVGINASNVGRSHCGEGDELELPSLAAHPNVQGLGALWRHDIEHQWWIEKVKIDALVRTGSPRSTGEDEMHVQRLAEAEWPLPPILVHRTTMRIIDGFHRVSAAARKGIDEIEAYLIDAPIESAFVIAVEANVRHGLPLSLADRRAAATNILQAYPQWSDRVIASSTGLSARTVCSIRCATADAEQLDGRLGKDGRMRPLSTAAGRKLAAEIISARPNASLREIAEAAGISPGTVRDVRARLARGDYPVPVAGRSTSPPGERGGQRPSRRSTVVDREPGEVNSLLHTLSRDPALRMNDGGRELLRWLHLHAVNTVDSVKIMDSVPHHCVEHLVELASRCSANWALIARDLAQHRTHTDSALDVTDVTELDDRRCG
jgi:ParB-like chromosome segregation protein Spo0J